MLAAFTTGETLYALARAPGVTMSDLLERPLLVDVVVLAYESGLVEPR